MQGSVSNPLLITGASGILGSKLRDLLEGTGITSKDLDITDESAVAQFFKRQRFSTIVHCAAYTDVAGAEKNKERCYAVNVIGTRNLVTHSQADRIIYISTDYVFDGSRGMYTEEDETNPVNYYAETKLLGEHEVKKHSNSLIIRTTFKPDGKWPYPKAFDDVYMSADPVSVRAPQIARAIGIADLSGIIHIAGERKSVYELAKSMSPDVGRMSRHDVPVILPRDVSLDCSRWYTLIDREK